MVNERLGIVRPYDLKTTSSPVWQFRKSFEKYNYFRQAAFYTYALANTENFADYKDFTWEPFKFVVAQKKKDTPPIVYEVTQNDLHCGRWGGRLRKNNVKLKGFHNLIEDYQWHVQTEVWDMPRTEYLNKGKLDVFQLETKEINNLI